jgi:hypothetical protein
VARSTASANSLATNNWTMAQGSTLTLTPSQAFAYWMETDATDADLDNRGLNFSNRQLLLPYFNEDHYAYSEPNVHYNHEYTPGIDNDTIGVSRFYNYKPDNTLGNVFERTPELRDRKHTNASYRLADNLVTVPLDFTYNPAGSDPQLGLVGNPFMASIDVAQLVSTEGNAGRIKSGYQVYDHAAKTYVGYNPDGNFGGGDHSKSQYIAPKQAFVVEKAVANTSYPYTANPLRFNASLLTNHGQTAPRLAPRQIAIGDKLDIVASNAVSAIRTFIATRESGSQKYGDMDSRKLINKVSRIPEIYTLKPLNDEMIAAGANIIPESKGTIPLGLATTYSGLITLTFTGMDTYDAEITFIDEQAKTELKLTGKSQETYRFNNVPVLENGIVQAVENRFFIRFSSSDGSDESDCDTKVYPVGKSITATSSATIRELTVYDTAGRKIYRAEVNDVTHNTPPLMTGAYTVRIVTDNCSDTVKVIVK